MKSFWLFIPNVITVIKESCDDKDIDEALKKLTAKKISWGLVSYVGGVTNIISDSRVIGTYHAFK